MKMNEKRKWKITLTEEQLYVLMNAVEDWNRFICGECSMSYATSYIESPKTMHMVRDILNGQVKTHMFPELFHGQGYSWNGGQPNKHMSKSAAISYMIYREIRHQVAVAKNRKDDKTLTCDDQGPMIKVELLD